MYIGGDKTKARHRSLCSDGDISSIMQYCNTIVTPSPLSIEAAGKRGKRARLIRWARRSAPLQAPIPVEDLADQVGDLPP